MQHKKVSFDLTQNYIPDSPQTWEPSAEEVENHLLRDIVNENLTKRQKCYIILYYKKKMTMQQIADKEGVSKSTVSRTLSLARKKIAGGIKPALLKSAFGAERKA